MAVLHLCCSGAAAGHASDAAGNPDSLMWDGGEQLLLCSGSVSNLGAFEIFHHFIINQ